MLDAVLRVDTIFSSALLPENELVTNYLPDVQRTQERESSYQYPQSYVLAPIHSRLEEPRGKVVAFLLSSVNYALPLKGIIPKGLQGAFVVVFRNNCNQTFSFQIEEGKDPVWLGNGDHHSNAFHSLEVSQSLGRVTDKDLEGEINHCQYSVVSQMKRQWFGL